MLPVLTGLSNNELERVSYLLLINRSMILTLLINFWVLLFCSVTQDRSEKHFVRRMFAIYTTVQLMSHDLCRNCLATAITTNFRCK